MKHPNAKQRLIGYARVSTDEQATEAQEMELRTAGCETIVVEHGSGASRARPALAKLVDDISAGDVLVVVRLDRLARSVSHLLAVIEDLTDKGAHFRSLRDPIDTSTPQGMFSLQVLGRRRTAGTRADFGADQSRNRGRPEEGEAARQSGHPGATSCCAGEDRRGAASLIWRPHPGFHERLVAHGATNEAGPSLGRCGARLEPERCEVDARTTTTGCEMARCRTPG